MLALEVEYLMGRATASERHNRSRAEWPPHPSRLFSAFVSAYKECDSDDAERDALLWLERQQPPALSVTAAFERDILPVFVPVNDPSVPDKVPASGFSYRQIKEGLTVLGERRSRKERTFPSVVPDRPIVYFIWQDANPQEVERHRAALVRLAGNVTCLGHSSSPVRVAICDQPPPATWEPAESGEDVLRVPTPGRLVDLELAYENGLRPSPGMFYAYAPSGRGSFQSVPETVFGEMIVFRRVSGPRLPLHACGHLTTTIRQALMKHSGTPPEVLSGHTPDGGPSQQPHVAIVPLSHVGHHIYADGSLMGFAIVLPRRLHRFDDPDRSHVSRALLELNELVMGRAGVWHVERLTAESPKKSLQTEEYIGPARSWATVTPMLFDYVPKNKPGKDAASVVALACQRIGLPPPVSVEFGPVSPFRGVPPSAHFKLVRKDRRSQLPRLHVVIEYDRPVRGPIILGAGRYLGLGLCRRLDHGDREAREA
jgi:CRISPR-associated protein Csb2